MSLERKDVRFKLDDDAHARLAVVAGRHGKDMGVYVEELVNAAVNAEVHAAILLVAELQRQGVAGNLAPLIPASGNAKKHQGVAGNA